MKKLLILLLFSAVPAAALSVEVDGRRLPQDPPARLSQGRVSVPLRAIFQALGATVSYRDGLIEAVKGERTVTLRTGRSEANVDRRQVRLDAPAQVLNGVTYVPLRFVAQALGEAVAWDGRLQRVTIGETGSVAGPLPDLSRLAVGNQGGVLKVWNRTKDQVEVFRGIDDRSVAPLSRQDQQAILQALNLEGPVDTTARTLISHYHSNPGKEALALLGVLNSLDGSERISTETARELRAFLSQVMTGDKNVVHRRQAVLALAVGNGLEDTVIDSVLNFYASTDNLWETFPVQQFFEYQSQRLAESEHYPRWKAEALAVNSLYRDNIASYLP